MGNSQTVTGAGRLGARPPPIICKLIRVNSCAISKCTFLENERMAIRNPLMGVYALLPDSL